MKTLFTFALLFSLHTTVSAEGAPVDYTVGGDAYEGYYTQPAEGAPLVLILHDWDGLTDYEIQRADLLAGKGYAVFAADLFGKGVRPTKVEDKRQHTGELYQDREKMRALISAALHQAGERGADTDSVVIMGYCFGGAAVLEAARAGIPAKGYVTFHGGLSTPEGQSYADTEGEVLVFHGTADAVITMDHFAALAKELEEHQVPHEMITYGGAPHAFTVFGSDRYRKDADEKSWARFLTFLARVAPTSSE
jgi:dienelactone hydrolase